MRRLLVLSFVTALLGVLVAVAPAVVRPAANRAEASVVSCDPVIHTIARHSIYAAKMRMCIEYFSNSARPGAKVDCVTATTHVSCNWAMASHDVGLYDMGGYAIWSSSYGIHAVGKTNGAYIATPDACTHSDCLAPNPLGTWGYVQVRFPDGHLTDPHYINYSDF